MAVDNYHPQVFACVPSLGEKAKKKTFKGL